MQSEWVDIDKIKLWDRNPRINEHVIQQIAVSIQQFGFINPIIVQRSTNKIIAGNTRFKAGLKLNLPKVPVIYVDLDNERATAYAIADNKLGELALWDDELLKDLMLEIQESDIDLETLGFDEYELDSIFNDSMGDSLFDSDQISDDIADNATENIVITCSLNSAQEIREAINTCLVGYDDVTIK